MLQQTAAAILVPRDITAHRAAAAAEHVVRPRGLKRVMVTTGSKALPSIRLNPAISFYATKAEVATWVADWACAFKLHALFVKRLKGGVRQEIAWDHPAGVRKLVGNFDRLLLDVHPLKGCDSGCKVELLERNPNCLYIDLPKQSKQGLKPGHLGSIAKDAGCLRVYRRIGAELVKRTEPGVWFVNSVACKKWFSKVLRYSPGVAKAVSEGLQLLPEGGRSTVHLDEPAEPTAAPDRGRLWVSADGPRRAGGPGR